VIAEWLQILALVHDDLSQRLGLGELSALYACIPDCFRDFSSIYGQLIPSLAEAARARDYSRLLERVDDLAGAGGRLQHIARHLEDAQAGFVALIRLLEEKDTTTER